MTTSVFVVPAHMQSTKHTAHVIQCNDMVVCVVLGTESEAAERMATEREAYLETNKWSFKDGRAEMDTPEEIRKRYLLRCHWHIRTVPLY